MVNNFLSVVGKLRWIQRWSLKRNTITENVMEHSWEVAVISHLLGVINNDVFGGDVRADRLASVALYHDCTEAITGDLPTPIKYYSEDIQRAYKLIEKDAQHELIGLLPAELQGSLRTMLTGKGFPLIEKKLLKAADTLSAYLKARAECSNGNVEYERTTLELENKLSDYGLPEVDYFILRFAGDHKASQALHSCQVMNAKLA